MRRFSLVLFLVAPVFFAGNGSLWAQKKPLDHDVYDGWQSVAAIQLSPDGRLLSYEVRPQEGDGTLYLKNLATGAELPLERLAFEDGEVGLLQVGDALVENLRDVGAAELTVITF